MIADLTCLPERMQKHHIRIFTSFGFSHLGLWGKTWQMADSGNRWSVRCYGLHINTESFSTRLSKYARLYTSLYWVTIPTPTHLSKLYLSLLAIVVEKGHRVWQMLSSICLLHPPPTASGKPSTLLSTASVWRT